MQNLDGRHPGIASIARYFAYDHLPPHLRAVSQPCGDLAGLRKLLEAKDCFVRAALDTAQSG